MNSATEMYMYVRMYIHTYSFKDPLSAQVRLNVEFVMKRATLQYAIKSNK